MICCGHLRVYALLALVVVYCSRVSFAPVYSAQNGDVVRNACLGRVPPELTDMGVSGSVSQTAVPQENEAGSYVPIWRIGLSS